MVAKIILGPYKIMCETLTKGSHKSASKLTLQSASPQPYDILPPWSTDW